MIRAPRRPGCRLEINGYGAGGEQSECTDWNRREAASMADSLKSNNK